MNIEIATNPFRLPGFVKDIPSWKDALSSVVWGELVGNSDFAMEGRSDMAAVENWWSGNMRPLRGHPLKGRYLLRKAMEDFVRTVLVRDVFFYREDRLGLYEEDEPDETRFDEAWCPVGAGGLTVEEVNTVFVRLKDRLKSSMSNCSFLFVKEERNPRASSRWVVRLYDRKGVRLPGWTNVTDGWARRTREQGH